MKPKANLLLSISSNQLLTTEGRGYVNLIKYFKKILRKIFELLKQKDTVADKEIIHALRVEIKKISALFKLIRSAEKGFNSGKHFKPFLQLFKKAGKLRSIQVEFDLINGYFKEDGTTNYLYQIHDIKHKRRIQFCRFIRSGIVNELRISSKKIKPHLKLIKKNDLKKYFSKEEKRIHKLMAEKIFREQVLHVVRKNVKQYYLNRKNISPFAIDDYWNQLLELMGKWHDCQVAFDQLIKAIYSGRLSLPEIDHLQNVKAQIQNDKNLLFERIVAGYMLRKIGV